MTDYSDTNAFAGYTLNKYKVDELLTGDGYTKGSDGIYAKGGQKLSFTVKSTAGNKRRELTEQIIQQQLKDAGIEMKIENAEAGDLFGSILPKGDYQAGIYAQVLTALTPGNCMIFCTANIPTSPDFSGNNWTRTNVPALEAPAARPSTTTSTRAPGWPRRSRPTRSSPRTWSRCRSTRCPTSCSGARRSSARSTTTPSSVRSGT